MIYFLLLNAIVLPIAFSMLKYGMIKTAKKIITMLGLISIPIVIYLIISEPVGYCVAEQRFLSDDDFLKIATRGEPTYEYYRRNPNCCAVQRGGDKHLDIGRNYMLVHMLYERYTHEEDIVPPTKVKYEKYITFDPCGKAVDIFGMEF